MKEQTRAGGRSDSQQRAVKHFDLGHGLCANPFYEQCPHRLACARCPFYRPKASTLEANTEAVVDLRQMTRMQQALTLTNDELAALPKAQTCSRRSSTSSRTSRLQAGRHRANWKTAPDAPSDHRTNHRALARAASSPTR